MLDVSTLFCALAARLVVMLCLCELRDISLLRRLLPALCAAPNELRLRRLLKAGTLEQVTKGVPIEHIRHMRRGGYDFGATYQLPSTKTYME